MKSKNSSTFDPHESVWTDALTGRPLAPFWRRFSAYAGDLLVASALFVPLYVEGDYLHLRAKGQQDVHIVVVVDYHNIWSLIWLVFYFGISTWYWNGSTLGKRLFRIRVVSLVGPKITLWQSFERALGYGASALEMGFGFIQYFIHHNRQCVHDRIAETAVIYVGKMSKRPAAADGETEKVGEAAPISDRTEV